MSPKPALLNVAEQPFSDQRRRNQMIFERLVSDGTLFDGGLYINPPAVANTGMRSIEALRKLARPFAPAPASACATLATPSFVLPFSWRRPIAYVQAAFFAARLRRVLAGKPYWLWVNNPDFGPFVIAEALQTHARRVVFDLSDDFTTFADRDPEGLRKRVNALVKRADALLAVNEHVASKFPHPRSLVFPNATDFESFQHSNPDYRLGDVLPKPKGRRYVGFIGGLFRGRADERLLDDLVDQLPEVTFLFVGYTNDNELFRRLAARPNVRVYPPVSYANLPFVIRSFDVAVVPHLDNEFTRGNDLLKVRDYLACGVPVVSTRSSNIERFGDAVYVAGDRGAFIHTVRQILSGDIRHDPRPGLAIARRESWGHAVPRLVRWLREGLAR